MARHPAQAKPVTPPPWIQRSPVQTAPGPAREKLPVPPNPRAVAPSAVPPGLRPPLPRIVQGALDPAQLKKVLDADIKESGAVPKQNVMVLVAAYNAKLPAWQSVRASAGWSGEKDQAFKVLRAAKEKLLTAVAFGSTDLINLIRGDFLNEIKIAAHQILADVKPPAGLDTEPLLKEHPTLSTLAKTIETAAKDGHLPEAVRDLSVLESLYLAAAWWRAIKGRAGAAYEHSAFRADAHKAASEFRADFRANRVTLLAERKSAIEKVVTEFEAFVAEAKTPAPAAEDKKAEPPRPRLSGIRGRGTYIPQTDPDFTTGPVGFAICKITGAGAGARAALVGGVGKGAEESTQGPPEALLKKLGSPQPHPFPRNRHGEDDWFIDNAKRIDELKGGVCLEVLDSAVPCGNCLRTYIYPLRRFVGVPVFVYTFRDDHHGGKRIVYEVVGDDLKPLGEWVDPKG
jgi:hypothetical protein